MNFLIAHPVDPYRLLIMTALGYEGHLGQVVVIFYNPLGVGWAVEEVNSFFSCIELRPGLVIFSVLIVEVIVFLGHKG